METISLYKVECRGSAPRYYSSLRDIYKGYNGKERGELCTYFSSPCCLAARTITQVHLVVDFVELSNWESAGEYVATLCERCNELFCYSIFDFGGVGARCFDHVAHGCSFECDMRDWAQHSHRCDCDHQASSVIPLQMTIYAELPYLSEHIGDPPWRLNDADFEKYYKV